MSVAPLYLDHAAATPLAPKVLEAMLPFLTEQFYNPSADYVAARSVRSSLDNSRSSVAQVVGARPSEIIFTAGGSEANNLAIHGIMRQYPQANLVVSSIEHESVLAPAERYDCRLAPVHADGVIDLEQLSMIIDDRTVLVSVMHANNEIGTIQPIGQISRLIKTIREQRRLAGNDLPLLLHADACQAANYLDIHVSRLGVDLMTLNGGKVYGPKQSGALYVRGGLKLTPLIDGGGQERGLRAGTENVAQAVGLATALASVQRQRSTEVLRLQELQKLCFSLVSEAMPTASLNGSTKSRLPNNIHLTIPGVDNERILIQLDEQGIMAAAGSACSASSDEPSHVLRAIGLSDDQARASLRLTMGQVTTEDDIRRVVTALSELI
ncbi:MAG: cysteine desulfurase family protein [Candidatus Saccharimonadales bacterium]